MKETRIDEESLIRVFWPVYCVSAHKSILLLFLDSLSLSLCSSARLFACREKQVLEPRSKTQKISSTMVAVNNAPTTFTRSTSTGTTHIPHTIIPLPSVVKGRSDWREYRPFQLENGMQCMLVHDKESKFTAMSVAVNVGASSDPRSLSGLAHFTEHMCFLGSEKYPGENEYKKYLSSHGGKSNASTSMSFTTFKFDVLAEHAEQAVDIFSQFFIAPLFSESGSTREVNAVDSENTRNIADDGRRRLQVLKAIAKPDHHFSKFSTGNKQTLAGIMEEDPSGLKRMRKAVLAFHRKHYQPENMVCVIVGPQSLDQLQEWIVPKFAGIEKKQDFPLLDKKNESTEDLEMESLMEEAARDAPPTRYTDTLPKYNPAFTSENQGGWPIVVTMDPLKLQRKLVLLFPLPSVYKSPDTSPVAFLSHLLGYEGPGSPFAVLQDAGLVNVISTGSRINAPDQCLFQVDISLTESGEDQWKDVVQVIFQYIRLIEKTAMDSLAVMIVKDSDTVRALTNGPSESSHASELHRIWDEIASIKSMNFNFTAPGNAYDFAPDLAQSIMSHGTKYCLTAGRKIADEPTEVRPSLPLQEIHDFATRMLPENCIIERFSKRGWAESNQVHSTNHSVESAYGELSTFGLRQEKWYGVNYIVSSVNEEDIVRWKVNENRSTNGKNMIQDGLQPHIGVMEMHLPKPNQFLPRSLELSPDLPDEARVGPRIEREMDPPNLISPYDDTKRLWHRLDDRYALPKSSFVLLLRNPCVEHTYDGTDETWRYDEHSALCSSLLMNMFSDGLAQATYDASVAGLSWSASKSASGLSIACIGYSDRLPELALLLIRAFCDKVDGSPGKLSMFLTENLFSAAKDRMTRSLQSYFQSGRADAHAFYYRDFVLTGRGRGVDHKLELLNKIRLSDIVQQRDRILLYSGAEYDCLYSGNVPEGEAKDLFRNACNILESISPSFKREGDSHRMRWIPGPVARKLVSGEDVQLHFSSQNPEEQSGAVVMTFQSAKSSFKGPFLSPNTILKDTAAVRLICHIMREPFFNELRTKQQLGYVVHSSYELAFSSAWPDSNTLCDEASTLMRSLREITPIDSLVMSILSKNTNPVDVASRIDNFLAEFRVILETMPQSELQDHAASVSRQLRKPIQSLGDEVSLQFSKIQLYAPEILSKGGSPKDMPWKNAEILSDEIVNLNRLDLLQTWDRLVTSKQRSRITSFVYGKSFPLAPMSYQLGSNKTAHFSLDELLHRRLNMASFTGSVDHFRFTNFRRGFIGLTALAVIGASILKFATARADDRKRDQS